jgi:hypothetical protein
LLSSIATSPSAPATWASIARESIAAATVIAGASGAGGGEGAAGAATCVGVVDRATTVRVEGARALPDVPVTAAVEAAAGMSIRRSTRSLTCLVTTCMRCVSSPVSISVSCCAATCSARRLLVYE